MVFIIRKTDDKLENEGADKSIMISYYYKITHTIRGEFLYKRNIGFQRFVYYVSIL